MSNYVPLTQGIGQSSNNIKKSFGIFSNNKFISGSKEFLESNSSVAKVAFLIFVLICFILLLRIGAFIIKWAMSPPQNPKVINGMIDATTVSKVIPQDPKSDHSITILRSKNEHEGIEFSWSVWLFVKSVDNNGKYKHIFHKGNDGISQDGMNFPNNGPGLYLGKDENDLNSLVIAMNTYNEGGSQQINETAIVKGITLNKWINVIIRVQGKKLDTYINGIIANRHILNGVPKQNYGDIYVTQNGGFNGLLSDLWYHKSALSAYDIQKIVDGGPNLKTDSDHLTAFPKYYSLKWYFNQ